MAAERTGGVEGKAALVTGAASGIGRATALALGQGGARVLVADRDRAGAQAAAEAILEAGGEAEAHAVDVARADEVEAMVRAAVARFGRLDCAVNAAGILATPALLHELALDAWERTIAVNLTGVFLCMQHELRAMRAQGAGAIVNVASGAGVLGTPALGHYCASKHGILGLTKTAALENARAGVRVNAICPGSTDTPMLQGFMGSSPEARKMILASAPAGRLGTPEEVAEAALWLCSERASYVSGESLFVDFAAVAR
ncbi:MAG: short chain dehydrogenase [Proteobacteria bacterium]|nr:MAG: short chain dehydrogenase [Pseudomonadota bacterium]